MATSPSPFFFPCTTPAYAPTTYFPPPPFGFGAPATGSFPVPAYGFCPFQQPPTPSSTLVPTNVEPNWPPPAPDPTPPIPTSTPSRCWSSSTITPMPPPHPATPRQMLSSAAPSSSSLAYPLPPPTTGAPANSATPATPAPPATSTSSPACGYFTEAATILHRVQRELINLQGRLCQQQALEQTSFNTLKGEFAKLKSSASQCAVSAGKQSSRAIPSSSPLQVIGTAPVTPKVFDAMPTPSTSQGTHGSAPAYHSGHHTPIRSTLLDGNSNLREQNVKGMHQAYSLHNLICQTVVRADGTEHSYYALPENYRVERATSKHRSAVFDDKTENASNESVHVFGSTPDQQPYEEEQQDSEQLLKYVGKALETEQTSANVLDYSLKQEQNDEKAVGNVQKPRDSHWNVLVIPVRRREWDPGEHTDLSSTLNKDALGVPILVPQQSCYYRVPLGQENHGIQFLLDPGILRLTDMILGKIAVASLLHSGQTPCKLLILIGQPVDLKHFWLQLLQSHSWYITTSVCLHVQYCCLQTILACPYSVLVCYYSKFSPRKTVLSAICLTTAPTVRMILVCSYGKVAQEGRDEFVVYQVFKIQTMRKTSHIWDPGVDLFSYKKLHLFSWIPHSVILVLHKLRKKNISCMWECLLEKGRQVHWDPGIKIPVYDESDEVDSSWPNGFIAVTKNTMEQKKCKNEQSISDLEELNGGENLSVATQYVDPLLKCCSKALKCRAWSKESQVDVNLLWGKSRCHNVTGLYLLRDLGDTKFRDLFATKLQCTDAYTSAMVQILVVQFGASRAPVFQSATMRSYAFGLGWTKMNASAQFALAVPCSKGNHYLLLANSSNSMTNHSFAKLFMKFLWATATVQVRKQKNHLEFLSIAEMLQIWGELRDGQLAYMPQDTIVTSGGITNWTSTTSNGITSYAFPMNFIIGHWAYVHQQGVHENYNAKLLLLSSKKYLSIWEIDIIFVTFRPP